MPPKRYPGQCRATYVFARVQYPMEFAKTRVQLRQDKGIPTPRNPFLVVTQVYQNEGIRALYKGCGALVFVSVASLSLFMSPDLHALLSQRPDMLVRNDTAC